MFGVSCDLYSARISGDRGQLLEAFGGFVVSRTSANVYPHEMGTSSALETNQTFIGMSVAIDRQSTDLTGTMALMGRSGPGWYLMTADSHQAKGTMLNACRLTNENPEITLYPFVLACLDPDIYLDGEQLVFVPRIAVVSVPEVLEAKDINTEPLVQSLALQALLEYAVGSRPRRHAQLLGPLNDA